MFPSKKPQSQSLAIKNKKKIALGAILLVSLFIPLLFSAIGFFLSLWIVVPAPTYFLLPLGVGAPEISPWLMVINGIALVLTMPKANQSWLYTLALILSICGLLLTLVPLIQFPAANAKIMQEMESVLGADYQSKIPPDALKKMRSQPLILKEVFRGITIPEVRIIKGITFAKPDGVELKLNLYQPLAEGKYPGLIMIYGGAWRQGKPDNNGQFSRYMAAQGYAVVTIDYRHAPEYKFPAQLLDVNTALAYIHENSEDLEIDIERVALIGRSAGAQLAMLAGYEDSVIPIQALVNYYGPVNLTQGYYDPPVPNPINTRDVLESFLGGNPEQFPQLYQQASPINYVKGNLPPSMLVYAGRDHLVQNKFGKQLAEKLKEEENIAVWLDIPWAEHAFDAVFNGVSNQLVLYYVERFLAWSLSP